MDQTGFFSISPRKVTHWALLLWSVMFADNKGQLLAKVEMTEVDGVRHFLLQTTAQLYGEFDIPPRKVVERPQWPLLRTGNNVFDGLYYLALEEVTENSVTQISAGDYNQGRPIVGPSGGLFETGELWKYVWTRDLSYSVDLSLALLDSQRARNSLVFKLSPRRRGGDWQIIQDTGTGGSYPISTDRVVWALGAYRLLHFLDGEEQKSFLATAFEALSNTIEQDRASAFDESMKLYRGEQSFLDWREQSYPGHARFDPIQIGLSHALSTNLLHFRALEICAELAQVSNNSVLQNRYHNWANDLHHAIVSNFFLTDRGLFSTMLPTFFDSAPVRRFDLLGNALGILFDLVPIPLARNILGTYPHLAAGPPVVWPQEQRIPIYHNRAIWPFVTAYWLKAAKLAQHAAAVTHNVYSLLRAAELYLSNMENLEMVTGTSKLHDGEYSGPVINSRRQLWSVAGYLSMVYDIFFGLETSLQGIRFSPYLTKQLHWELFRETDHLMLKNLPFRHHSFTVVVHLPKIIVANDLGGAYSIREMRLNGQEIVQVQWLDPKDLPARNLVEIFLAPTTPREETLTLISDTNNYQNLFAPFTPTITQLGVVENKIQLQIDIGQEKAKDIRLNIYRDGKIIAWDLPGTTTNFIDQNSAIDGPSYCYSVDATFLISNNSSHHARPVCYWGTAEAARVYELSAVQSEAKFRPKFSGEYLFQVVAANGSGTLDSGITCGVKKIEILEADSGKVVAAGMLIMPILGRPNDPRDPWSFFGDSSLVRATLRAQVNYQVKIHSDDQAINMSAFTHNDLYNKTGGVGGEFNSPVIVKLKVLWRGQ